MSESLHFSMHSWVEIDSKQLVRNIKKIKQLSGNAQLGVIIKGNAYGHGIAPIVQILQARPEVDWAIAFRLTEALQARKSGFTKSLLVCGYVDGPIADAIEQNIDLVLYDYVSLQQYIKVSIDKCRPVYVHLKVDTGLNRLGFTCDQAIEVLKDLQLSSQIVVRGLFTHFAESDAEDNWYAKQQLAAFNDLLNRLAELNIKIPIVHLANTIAIFRLPETRKTLVRVGGGVYGLRKQISNDIMPTSYYDLLPVITWKSKIIQIRQIPAGSFVSYGRTFKAVTPMTIATIPVGYADGYAREYSNNGVIYTNGILASVVGRVCMNLVMVDITSAKKAQVGDEVILLGDIDGVRVTDLMQRLGTIACDVTTRINWTISRVVV